MNTLYILVGLAVFLTGYKKYKKATGYVVGEKIAMAVGAAFFFSGIGGFLGELFPSLPPSVRPGGIILGIAVAAAIAEGTLWKKTS